MKKLLVRLVLLPVLLVAAVFALSNRETVELSLWPLPWAAQAPLFLLLLATLLLGVLIGAGLTWAAGWQHRSNAREHRRNNERLQRQLDAAKLEALKPRMVTPVTVLPPPARMPANKPANISAVSDRALQPPPSFTPVNRVR